MGNIRTGIGQAMLEADLQNTIFNTADMLKLNKLDRKKIKRETRTTANMWFNYPLCGLQDMLQKKPVAFMVSYLALSTLLRTCDDQEFIDSLGERIPDNATEINHIIGDVLKYMDSRT